MITNLQYRRLKMSFKKKKKISKAALISGMSEPTARKYINLNKAPNELKKEHTWKTREDVFAEIWSETEKFLKINHGVEAKTLFEYIQKENPGKYSDGQLRTFQRKVKIWKATEGPAKEIYFPQIHYPGDLCEADFSSMNELNITINKESFKHLIFHFVLTFSNWETGTICYSESLEALSEGLQNAFWELGGVPTKLRTDNLTAAIYKDLNKKTFTDRYEALLNHYKLEGQHIQAYCPNENGDIEQRHYRFKKAVAQALIFRGNNNFDSIEEYDDFLKKIFNQLNSGRVKRFSEETSKLKKLPKTRLDDFKEYHIKVGHSSTINISHNTYSVDSRLKNENIKVLQKANSIEIRYGGKKIDEYPRLRGTGKHFIQYQHIIDSLIRKPGAFKNYRYRDELFPTFNFRMTYDYFKKHNEASATKKYLQILQLATLEGELKVDNTLSMLLDENSLTLEKVKDIVKSTTIEQPITNITVADVNLLSYDELIQNLEVLYAQS